MFTMTRVRLAMPWVALGVGALMAGWNLRNYIEASGGDRLLFAGLVLFWVLYAYFLYDWFRWRLRPVVKPENVRVRHADGRVTGPYELSYIGRDDGVDYWILMPDQPLLDQVDLEVDKCPARTSILVPEHPVKEQS